jgi:hypothetical protein
MYDQLSYFFYQYLCSKKLKSVQVEEADIKLFENEDLIYRSQQTPSIPDSDEVTHRLIAQDRQFYQVVATVRTITI